MDPIYLDYGATTPMRTEVREAMAPFHGDAFGNPSSTHRWGRAAAAALDRARADAAEALGVSPSEIYFTRGGTESDNLAVFGRCEALRADGSIPSLVVSAIEHPAVMDASAEAERRGDVRRVVLDVAADGGIDIAPIERALESGPTVVSLMWVNNETGAMLPLRAVAARVRDLGGTMHSDAVQAVGKVPVRLADVPVDLLSVTGHKIYGPKGSGLLYVRSGVAVRPALYGGGQERGLRPGTEDVAGAVGLATALRLAVAEQPAEAARLGGLRQTFEEAVLRRIEGTRINAGGMPRAPHVSSLGIEGVPGDGLLMALDLEGIAASGGAACSSGSTKASHVIAALYGPDDTAATIRFTFGRGSTEADVGRAADTLVEIVTRLRAAA